MADSDTMLDVAELAPAVEQAPSNMDTTLCEAETRAADKKRQKSQRRLAAEFTQLMSGSIQSLEQSMQCGTASQKEHAKQRRLMLREVLKAVTDPGSGTEDRLRYLQGKYVQMVQEMNKQDQEVLRVQAQLDAATKDSAQIQAELSRANQKLERMQQLARTLQAENKLLEEDNLAKKKAIHGFQGTAERIQEEIAKQGEASQHALETNKTLVEENAALRKQVANMASLLEDSQNKIEAVTGAQKEQLEEVMEKMKQQAEWITKSQELHSHMSKVLEENKLLQTKAATAEQQCKQLEQINEVYKQQMDLIMKKADAGLEAATMQKKLNEKLQAELDRQRKLTPKMLQERKVLQQELSSLQGRVKKQADELRRSQLQKQHLEGLCRALQARAGVVSADPAAAATAAASETAEASSDDSQYGANNTACSDKQEAVMVCQEVDADVAEACSKLVKMAIDAVVAENGV